MYYSSYVAARKFHALVKDLPDLHFDSKNPHFKNQYLSLSGLLRALKPVLDKHNVILTTGTKVDTSSEGYNILDVEFLFLSDVDDASVDSAISTARIPVLDNPQHYGSYLTYARRYAILSALGVAPDEDDDGESTVTATKVTALQRRQGGRR